jgi:hypothetical protein
MERYSDHTKRAAGAGWQVKLAYTFYEVGTVIEYEYDFGDGWVHEITHEGILIREPGANYPRCVDGGRVKITILNVSIMNTGDM